MTTTPDYYEVLQVSPNADAEVIQAAYRRLAHKWHPDRNPGDPFAAERMNLLNEAYEVLSDPRARRKYDAQRQQSPASAGVGGHSPRAKSQAKDAPNPNAEPRGAAGSRANDSRAAEDNRQPQSDWFSPSLIAAVMIWATCKLLFGSDFGGLFHALLAMLVGAAVGPWVAGRFTRRGPHEAENESARSEPGESPRPAETGDHASWLKAVPDAPVIFAAGGVLFLLGHGGVLFDAAPGGLLTFLLTCFVWCVLFAVPAYFCHLNKQRTGLTVVAILFLLVAGVDVAIPVYVGHELKAMPRESPPLLPYLPEPEDSALGAADSFFARMSHKPEFLQEQATRDRSWEDTVTELRKRDVKRPDQYRAVYELHLQQNRLAEASRKQKDQGESLVEYLARRAIPVIGVLGDVKRIGPYGEAVKRFNAGKASKEDIDLIARFERQQGINQKQEQHTDNKRK